MSEVMNVIRGVERVQAQTGVSREQAWAAVHLCGGDAQAAIELARRLGRAGSGAASTQVLPSAEVLSMMYPACAARPRDHVKRVKAVTDATGCRLSLAVNALQMCDHDAGAAVRLLQV